VGVLSETVDFVLNTLEWTARNERYKMHRTANLDWDDAAAAHRARKCFRRAGLSIRFLWASQHVAWAKECHEYAQDTQTPVLAREHDRAGKKRFPFFG